MVYEQAIRETPTKEAPDCLQAGKYCRNADAEGLVHDALIIFCNSVIREGRPHGAEPGLQLIAVGRLYSMQESPHHEGALLLGLEQQRLFCVV